MSPHRRLHIIVWPARSALVTVRSGTAAAPSKTLNRHVRSPAPFIRCTSNLNLPASESLISLSHSTSGELVTDATMTEPVITSIRSSVHPVPRHAHRCAGVEGGQAPTLERDRRAALGRAQLGLVRQDGGCGVGFERTIVQGDGAPSACTRTASARIAGCAAASEENSTAASATTTERHIRIDAPDPRRHLSGPSVALARRHRRADATERPRHQTRWSNCREDATSIHNSRSDRQPLHTAGPGAMGSALRQ